MNFGQALAAARERMGFSQRELAARLTQHGVPVTNQAISKWEKGSTQPNATQFLTMCHVLQVSDVLGTFTDFRRVSPMEQLNRAGREKAEEYIRLLLCSGAYSARPVQESAARLRSLPLYHISVSAGTGQFLDSDHYDLVEVGDEVPMNANFGVRIAGDSMEPRFINGQIVWVHQQQGLESGEIGVFLYGGNAYCKKLSVKNGSVRLLSLNPEYAPIEIADGQDLRVFGKVVG